MRAIVQRVKDAVVTVEGRHVGSIDKGLLVYVGVSPDDTGDDVEYMANKIGGLRIFQDDAGKMNLDVRQVGGGVLLVSNFTLYADARQGRRPAFTGAAEPGLAERLFGNLASRLSAGGISTQTGIFGSMMSVSAANEGPINVLLDSKRLF